MTSKTQTAQELKSTYEQFAKDVWEDGNLDLVEEYVAEDYVEHNPVLPHEIRGVDGYRENVRMLRAAFPDLEADVEDVIVEGEFVGAPPTGNRFEAEAMMEQLGLGGAPGGRVR